MPIKTYCYEHLEDLLPRCKAVFHQVEHISFDLSYYWFENLINSTVSPQERLKIFVAEDGNGNVAIFPLCYDKQKVKPKKIRALSNFYTSLYAPICTDAVIPELLVAALSTLFESHNKWDVIELFPLSIEDGSFFAIFDGLRRRGMLTFKYFCFVNWYLTVGGRSYAEYFDSLPSRLKHTIKRKTKHFLAMESARLEIITSLDNLETGIVDYIKVYQSSWKIQEPFPGFIPGLLRMSAQRGWLRLGLAYLHNQPVAAQIWIVTHGRAAIYKIAHDEKIASYSVGSILTSHMMRHVIDVDKVSEVDYLIGDDPYKKDWMSHSRERWGIVAYNPRTLFGLFGAFKQVLGSLKRLLPPSHGSSR